MACVVTLLGAACGSHWQLSSSPQPPGASSSRYDHGATGQTDGEMNLAAEEIARSAMEAAKGSEEISQHAFRKGAQAAHGSRRTASPPLSSPTVSAPPPTRPNPPWPRWKRNWRKRPAPRVTCDGSARNFEHLGSTLEHMNNTPYVTQVELSPGEPPFSIRGFKGEYLMWQSRLDQVVDGRLDLDRDGVME